MLRHAGAVLIDACNVGLIVECELRMHRPQAIRRRLFFFVLSLCRQLTTHIYLLAFVLFMPILRLPPVERLLFLATTARAEVSTDSTGRIRWRIQQGQEICRVLQNRQDCKY